jgi:hypothetical protein
MSSESSAARAYRLGVANQVLLLVGPVAATSALGDRNSAVERTDIRSAGAAVSRVALGGVSRLRPGVYRPRMRQLHKFRITYLRRRSKPQPKSVIELLGKPSVSTAATSERCRELDEALRRFLEAQRARETQAEQAHHLASKFVRVDANSQERRAAAKTIAGAYDKARSLTQIELDLMVAEMIVRIPDYAERKRELQFSYEEYESFGIPGDYIQAAARWRGVVEFERSRSSVHGAHEGCWADVYDGDQEDRACEAEPDPKSALGLCVEHEVQIMKPAYGPEGSIKRSQTGQRSRSLVNGVRPARHLGT